LGYSLKKLGKATDKLVDYQIAIDTLINQQMLARLLRSNLREQKSGVLKSQFARLDGLSQCLAGSGKPQRNILFVYGVDRITGQDLERSSFDQPGLNRTIGIGRAVPFW